MQLNEKLLEILQKTTGLDNLNESSNLIEDGTLDSISIVNFIAAMESELNVKIEDEEVSPETFQSLKTIKELIETKLNEP